MSNETHANEIWLPVSDARGYEVSSQGSARSVDRLSESRDGHTRQLRGKLLSPTRNRYGHLYVSVAGTKHSVHRLVALAFLGPCPKGMQVCHNNGVPDDNRVANLRYGTASENSQDTLRHGAHRQRAKSNCPRGHALNPPNIVASKLARGYRSCLSCHRAHAAVSNAVRAGRVPPDFVATAEAYYASIAWVLP